MNRVRSAWRSGRRGKVNVLIGSVLLSCMACMLLIRLVPAQPTSTASRPASATAQSVAQAPATLAPTDPPKPTDTRVPPTVTRLPASPTPVPPSATPAPSNTPVPPTAPPASPTPRPTLTAAPSRAQVNGQAIETVFRNQGFIFQDASPVESQPRRMANASSRLTLVELIGNPKDLTKATIAVGIPNDNPQAVQLSAGYLVLFLSTALPGWDNGVNWMTASMEAFNKGQQETTNTYQGRTIKMTNQTQTLGLVFLSIE